MRPRPYADAPRLPDGDDISLAELLEDPGDSVELEIGPVQPNWFSAMWEFEPVGNGAFRIKNPYRNTYLNIETGRLQLGDVQPGWLSAQWRQVPVAQEAASQPEQHPVPQPAQPAQPSIGAPVGTAAANARTQSWRPGSGGAATV